MGERGPESERQGVRSSPGPSSCCDPYGAAVEAAAAPPALALTCRIIPAEDLIIRRGGGVGKQLCTPPVQQRPTAVMGGSGDLEGSDELT